MAVEAIYTMMIGAFINFIVFRKVPFLMNLFYMIMGIITFVTLDSYEQAIGILITFMGFIGALYSLLGKTK